MEVAQLLEPILTGGIKDTHFFNGRLLTADDLRTMQRAARQHDAQLGRAIGDGVAYGFQVSMAPGGASGSTATVLHVNKGLAINRLGETVALNGGTDVALVRSLDTPVPEGVFAICVPPTGSEFLNLGLYLLTVAPASGFEGRAPMTELSTEGVGTSCGSRYEVDGVRFDMRPLTLPTDSDPAPTAARTLFSGLQAQLPTLPPTAVSPELHKLRNIVAHLCFGSDDVYQPVRAPLIAEDDKTSYDLLQRLRNDRALTDCEVPLALIYWSIRGIEFVDMWAVRRRLSVARHPHRPFSWLTVPRRTAIAEARLAQFQDQLEALRVSHPSPQTQPASTYFRFLPGAGLLPVAGGTGGKAFDYESFFQGFVYRKPVVFTEGARLEPLLRASLEFPAFDLTDPSMFWLYAARENSQAIVAGGTDVPPAYIAFATGHMPFYGLARFDVSQWDYSNFSAFDEGVFA
jgi:hypothetical protein